MGVAGKVEVGSDLSGVIILSDKYHKTNLTQKFQNSTTLI